MKATIIAHWATGPAFCCEDHAKKLKALGKVLGLHVPMMPYTGEEECSNCKTAEKETDPIRVQAFCDHEWTYSHHRAGKECKKCEKFVSDFE